MFAFGIAARIVIGVTPKPADSTATNQATAVYVLTLREFTDALTWVTTNETVVYGEPGDPINFADYLAMDRACTQAQLTGTPGVTRVSVGEPMIWPDGHGGYYDYSHDTPTGTREYRMEIETYTAALFA